MNFPFKTKKTKDYENKLKKMKDKSFDYKFKNKFDYYNGYIGANYDRSQHLIDYKDNLSIAFARLNKFKKLSKDKQDKILKNPYSGGNYHILFDMGYVDFYLDTKKKKQRGNCMKTKTPDKEKIERLELRLHLMNENYKILNQKYLESLTKSK